MEIIRGSFDSPSPTVGISFIFASSDCRAASTFEPSFSISWACAVKPLSASFAFSKSIGLFMLQPPYNVSMTRASASARLLCASGIKCRLSSLLGGATGAASKNTQPQASATLLYSSAKRCDRSMAVSSNA